MSFKLIHLKIDRPLKLGISALNMEDAGRARDLAQLFLLARHPRSVRQNLSSREDTRSCGAMDNASDYGSEDCRFESCQDRNFLHLKN